MAIYQFIDFTFPSSAIPAMGRVEKRALLGKITRYCLENWYTRTSTPLSSYHEPGQVLSRRRERKVNGYVQKKARRSTGGGQDRTGISREMKRKFEANGGLSFDDARATYNSPLPERLGALAFTRGTEVYIGPGGGASAHELGT